MIPIRDWRGVDNTSDPLDIPQGAMQVMENLQVIRPGELRVRPGLVKVSQLSFNETIRSVTKYRAGANDYALAVAISGKLLLSKDDGSALQTLKTGLNATYPWTFAQSRLGDLIGVTGHGAPGFRWDGSSSSADSLGMAAPTTNAILELNTLPDGASTEGVYTYAVRFVEVEGTGVDQRKIYSSLSPRSTLTSAGGEGFDWTAIPQPTESRVTHIELLRSTANAPNVLYVVGMPEIGSPDASFFQEVYSDNDLIDMAEQDQSKAVVIIAGRDTVVANSRGVPPDTQEVVIAFRDRFFYLVNSEGGNPSRNAMYYSGIDEPESVFTEFGDDGSLTAADMVTRQLNSKDPDSLVGAAAFHNFMYLFGDRSMFMYDHVRVPINDHSLRFASRRGLASQNAWDLADHNLFVIDQLGAYSVSPGSVPTSISASIQRGFFESTDGPPELTYEHRDNWHTVVDRQRDIVRFFVTTRTDGTTYPQKALVFNYTLNTWWVENYGFEVLDAILMQRGGLPEVILYDTAGNAYRFDETAVDDRGGVGIEYKLRTRPFRALDYVANAASSNENRRLIRIVHEAAPDESLTVTIYPDRTGTAKAWPVGRQIEAVSTIRGATVATVTLDEVDRMPEILLSGLREGSSRGTDIIEFELAGTQTTSRVRFNELQIEGFQR
jgi:hypothetical protein